MNNIFFRILLFFSPFTLFSAFYPFFRFSAFYPFFRLLPFFPLFRLLPFFPPFTLFSAFPPFTLFSAFPPFTLFSAFPPFTLFSAFPPFTLFSTFPSFTLFSAFPPFTLFSAFPLFRFRFSVSAFYPYPLNTKLLYAVRHVNVFDLSLGKNLTASDFCWVAKQVFVYLTLFTRYRICAFATSSSVNLQSYFLSSFLCNIIMNFTRTRTVIIQFDIVTMRNRYRVNRCWVFHVTMKAINC